MAQEPPRPAEKKAEPKKELPKSDEQTPEEEVHKTAERIAENAQKAGDRLKEKDPGEATRKIQQDIIKDIDTLIKKAQEPPPPPMSSDMNPMMPPPMGGMPPPKGGGMSGGSPMPKPGMSGGAPGQQPQPGRRQRRERKDRGGGSPMGMNEPMAKIDPSGMNPMPAKIEPKEGPTGGAKDKPLGDGLGDRFGRQSPKRENDKLADLYKDVWGHLPERLRQEMDLYYREQFMPRYSELLRRYYASLAEQRKKGSEDR
jgi:hypothetical protein